MRSPITKKDTYAAIQECRNWLQESDRHKYSKKQARETIKVFHRDTAKLDKETIIAEFQRLAEDSSIRVIFATIDEVSDSSDESEKE